MVNWKKLKRRIQSGEKDVLIEGDFFGIFEKLLSLFGLLRPLQSLSFYNSIPNEAFSGCRSLQSVTIPSGVTSIGDHAFYGCRSLTAVTIPSSVTSISPAAFSDSTKLNHIVTDNLILLDARNDQREKMGIHQACEIITPAALLKKTEVENTLSIFNHLNLTSAQKVFLYMNHHRWQRLGVEELREHVGDAPLELLKVLRHERREMAQRVRDQAVGVLEKVADAKFQGLGLALGQSSSFSTIENLTLWEKLVQTAKSDYMDSKKSNAPK